MKLTTPENSKTYHNALCLSTPKFCISIVFSFSWELKWPQEKLKLKLEWSIGMRSSHKSRACFFLADNECGRYMLFISIERA